MTDQELQRYLSESIAPPPLGDDASIERIESTIPIGRLAVPADIANACMYLASPLASYVTGSNLVVHGGGDRPPFLDA